MGLLTSGTTIEVLNLQKIFVNFLAGNLEIFFMVAAAIFAYLAARYRMPNVAFGLLMVLFVGMMAGLGYTLVWVLTLFIVGIIVFTILRKIFE